MTPTENRFAKVRLAHWCLEPITSPLQNRLLHLLKPQVSSTTKSCPTSAGNVFDPSEAATPYRAHRSRYPVGYVGLVPPLDPSTLIERMPFTARRPHNYNSYSAQKLYVSHMGLLNFPDCSFLLLQETPSISLMYQPYGTRGSRRAPGSIANRTQGGLYPETDWTGARGGLCCVAKSSYALDSSQKCLLAHLRVCPVP